MICQNSLKFLCKLESSAVLSVDRCCPYNFELVSTKLKINKFDKYYPFILLTIGCDGADEAIYFILSSLTPIKAKVNLQIGAELSMY